MKVLRAGPETAPTTLILLHGRGAGAGSILPLFQELGIPEVRALAPEAPGHTWYPYSFLAPHRAKPALSGPGFASGRPTHW